MTIQIPTYSERELNKFASEQWDKALAYLQKQFMMSTEDCQDVFQESFITLYENIQSGKLKELSSSLATYFMGICKLKAFEMLRKNGKGINVEDELSLSLISGEIRSDKIDTLLALEDEDESIKERKDALVRQIVNDLPGPCDKILWGYYRDNLNMKTMASMLNYSEGSIKVTKHRCCEKFHSRYCQLCESLF